MRFTMSPLAMAAVLLLCSGVCACGQPAGETESLRREVEELRANQEELEQELAELKEILAPVLDRLPKPFRPQDISIGGSPSMGEESAKVTMIEFTDMQCPFCVRYFETTFPDIVKDYVSTGKVRYVSREFPLSSIHHEAGQAARAALCAGDQDKYWEMRGKIFSNRENLSEDDLTEYALDSGVEIEAWRACLAGDKYSDKIRNDLTTAARLGVSGTPSFVLGLSDPDDATQFRAVKILKGAVPFEHFQEAIDELLASDEQ
jgi:protein-disulfide isomerase